MYMQQTYGNELSFAIKPKEVAKVLVMRSLNGKGNGYEKI